MRTFQYSDEKSHKFWNIELSGNDVTVTYGRVGSAGQTQTKTFKDAAAAQKEHDKLVKEKLGKGYTETGAAAAPKRSGSLREALEQALIENPDDTASHMAFADHLTESGDPLGEFVSIQIALEDESLSEKRRKELKAREKKLWQAHDATWLGDLAPDIDTPIKEQYGEHTEGCLYLHRRGWLDTLEIGVISVAFARRLAKAPQVRLLRTLRIYSTVFYDEDTDEDREPYEAGSDIPEDCENPGLYALIKSPYLGNVRVLQVGEDAGPDDKDTYYSCHTSGEGVLGLIKRMPKLEELYLTAHGVDTTQLFGLKTLNALRILKVYHLHRYPLDLLAKNPSLGNLTTLMFHPHGADDEHAYIRLPGLRAVVNSPHLKSLTHLHFRLHDVGDKGCEEIVKSGILKRLKVLDLAQGDITDEGAKKLAACPDLKNLEYLDLRKNTMTKAGIAALTATGVKLNAASQWKQTGEGWNDMEYLMEGDAE